MIAAALAAYGAKQQTVFAQDRSQTVGASEVGQCARAVWFAKNEGDALAGVSRDPDFVQRWGATLRGTVIERELWEPALRAQHGDRLVMAGRNQRTLVHGFLSATPDGVLLDQPADALARLGVADIEGDCLTVECKSIDPRANLDEAKATNVFQVHVQLGLVRELTPFRPMWAILSYIDASFWDAVREFPIRFDAAIYAEAQRRARDIMTARSAHDLKPEGVIAGGDACKFCAFTSACGVARADRVPTSAKAIAPELADSIVALALDAKVLRQQGDAAVAEARRIEEEVRALLAAAGTRRLVHGGISVTWSAVRGGNSDRLKTTLLAPASAVEPSPIPAPAGGLAA